MTTEEAVRAEQIAAILMGRVNAPESVICDVARDIAALSHPSAGDFVLVPRDALEAACKAHAPQWERMDEDIRVYARIQMEAAIIAYEAAKPKQEVVGRQWAAFENGEQRTSWREHEADDREDWEKLCDRHPDAGISIEFRDIFASPPDTAAIRSALRGFDCPRPCNNRPDDFTAGQCVDAGECGCMTVEVQTALKRADREGDAG